MTAESLAGHYSMDPHTENGLFIEKHYPHPGAERAASGSIYYYLGPEEYGQFHRVDCDEYWCYHAGTTLEIWIIDPSGQVHVRLCGITENAEPAVYIPKGSIFAERHGADRSDGTFVTCITVPRFRTEAFEMFSRQEIVKRYPQVRLFWEPARKMD